MLLSDLDVARYAYNAGWRGTDLVTATAIPLAENRGQPDSSAHGVSGFYYCGGQVTYEDSWGQYQINIADCANTWARGRNLTDPQVNANTAFELWNRIGNDFESTAGWRNDFTFGLIAQYTPRAQTAVDALMQQQRPPGFETQAFPSSPLPGPFTVVPSQGSGPSDGLVLLVAGGLAAGAWWLYRRAGRA